MFLTLWRIHYQLGKRSKTHLEFRRQVTMFLLKVQDHCNKAVFSIVGKQLRDVHFDGKNHFLGAAPSQGRCKACKKNTRIVRTKCNARLHGECGKTCIKTYHTRCLCTIPNNYYFSKILLYLLY